MNSGGKRASFKLRAMEHQIKYRTDILKTGYNRHKTWLTDDGIRNGLNFYNGFAVFDAVKIRYPGFKNRSYYDMLRSEHIPFNFFIPLKQNELYCRNVFNDILGSIIKSIDRVEIEYAPSPRSNYLNDRTSFDAYLEYTHINGCKGTIGVEVKYTERGDTAADKQLLYLRDKSSPYYIVSEKSKLYKPNVYDHLISKEFRQVWRNQLLGESIIQNDNISYSTLITVFPEGNTYYEEVCGKYIKFMNKNENKFIGLKYEDLFSILDSNVPGSEYSKWLNYLKTRYIVD